ncbi:hypothetical protein K505DRAFT_330076 [Melanomma pulvis-pyrius CBS 109.77]|uniref:C3H1-type domain-containing protein n=1 Tax=Melanomma pulvis-pyrius CBS 109.77 TaxID=1314802 RepID=A0A6A6WS98_9PLEO|nr:hypothetical protein K505DRAFT_330076 [Melanomma pulvis-pyrius CBS 109.77]
MRSPKKTAATPAPVPAPVPVRGPVRAPFPGPGPGPAYTSVYGSPFGSAYGSTYASAPAPAPAPAPARAPAPAPAPAPARAPAPVPRVVTCIRCHLYWWNDTCDGREPCNNCQADGAGCVHPKCDSFAAGTCKRGDKCKRAHEGDNFDSLDDFRKTLKRVGKKTDTRLVAPSVRAREMSAAGASGSGRSG